MDVQDIFGLPVARYKMETLDCTTMMDYLDKQTLLGKASAEGEYTEDQHILEHDIFKEVKQEVLHATKTFAQDAVGHLIDDVLVASSWANISEDNRQVRPHLHFNSYISGVFYLSSGSNINMFNPFKRTQMYMFNPLIAFNAENKFTWQSIALTPEPNMLLLFPSGLTHSVDPAPTRRYSIAYNTIPKGVVGTHSSTVNIENLDNSGVYTDNRSIDRSTCWTGS